MKERILFLIIVFGIAILLIAIIVPVYLVFFKEGIINNYDCYVFSIFWTPSSCATKNKGNEECFQKVKELKIDKYFTIHGMWPSLLSGDFVKSCNQGKKIIPEFNDDEQFHDKVKKFWPGLYSNNTYLWSNEYNKHGYCFIKRNHYNVIDDFKIYFTKSVDIFEKDGYKELMENMLPDSKGVYNVSKVKFKRYLQNALNTNESYFSLICSQHKSAPQQKYLTELRFVLDFNFQRRMLQKSQENCPDYFFLNFTDQEKIPVYDKYDLYIFSLSYAPTGCIFKGKSCYRLLRSKKYNKFTIHGLWPSYKSGVLPQECNIGEDIQIQLNNESILFENLTNKWFSLYNTDTYFWTHEYNKHGLCYTQRIKINDDNFEPYFIKGLELYQKNNFTYLFDKIYKNFLPREQLVNKTHILTYLEKKFVNNSFYLACKLNKNNNRTYLEDLRFKLDINFEFTSEGNYTSNCPEEFYLEITDPPFPEGKIVDDIWSTYDVYMYSVFWQTTTCKKKGYHCYNLIQSFPKNMWTIHGLWPNFKNGTVPDFCYYDKDMEIEIKNETLLKELKTYFPGVFRSSEGFWAYEYMKHGYCYNKRKGYPLDDYDIFFNKVVELYYKYDFKNIFINMLGDKLVKGDIKVNRDMFLNYFDKIGLKNNTYLLICDDILVGGKNLSYISEIRIRFDMDFTPQVNETDSDNNHRDCPFEFMAEFL